jgi:hypothetical protein
MRTELAERTEQFLGVIIFGMGLHHVEKTSKVDDACVSHFETQAKQYFAICCNNLTYLDLPSPFSNHEGRNSCRSRCGLSLMGEQPHS